METIEKDQQVFSDQTTSSITASDATRREGIVDPEHIQLESATPNPPATDDRPRTPPEPARGEMSSASSTNESAATQAPTAILSDIVDTSTEQQCEDRTERTDVLHIPGGVTIPAPPPIIPPTPPPLPPVRFSTPRVRFSTPANRSSRPVESRDSPVDRLTISRPACIVCLDDSRRCVNRPCCAQPVCRECMLQMTRVSINDGIAHIECPNLDCSKALTKDEVIELIGTDSDLRKKYDRFLVDNGADESKKTCPRCCLITEHRLPKKFRLKEDDVKLRCASCDLEWCFKCHAPWHAELTCKTFKKGDKQFQDWTKGMRLQGDANCRQCPTCRVYIQRNEGCDHMTCSRCESEFCYKCGGVYPWVRIPGVGNHHTPLGIFGCKYLYTSNATKRRAVRGSYLAAKVTTLAGYPFLFAGGVALLLGVGIVAVPIYVGYRVYRYHKNTSKYRVNRR